MPLMLLGSTALGVAAGVMMEHLRTPVVTFWQVEPVPYPEAHSASEVHHSQVPESAAQTVPEERISHSAVALQRVHWLVVEEQMGRSSEQLDEDVQLPQAPEVALQTKRFDEAAQHSESELQATQVVPEQMGVFPSQVVVHCAYVEAATANKSTLQIKTEYFILCIGVLVAVQA